MYMCALQITKEEFDMEARKLFKSDKGKFLAHYMGLNQQMCKSHFLFSRSVQLC